MVVTRPCWYRCQSARSLLWQGCLETWSTVCLHRQVRDGQRCLELAVAKSVLCLEQDCSLPRLMHGGLCSLMCVPCVACMPVCAGGSSPKRVAVVRPAFLPFDQQQPALNEVRHGGRCTYAGGSGGMAPTVCERGTKGSAAVRSGQSSWSMVGLAGLPGVVQLGSRHTAVGGCFSSRTRWKH
jgi:hypothetical protein